MPFPAKYNTKIEENIIGREREIKELNELYNSGKAELVALYGRRRVGKTFLVDEVLEGNITFRYAVLSPIEQEENNKKYNFPESTHFGRFVRTF